MKIREKPLDLYSTPPHGDDEIAISLLSVVVIRGVGIRENTMYMVMELIYGNSSSITWY